MSKRLIGIAISTSVLRIAILSQEKGRTTVRSLLTRDYENSAELSNHLKEVLAGEFRIGDLLATSLPAYKAYVRNLEFPFQDEKKISAAIPFSLSTQLPIAIDNCTTSIQVAQTDKEGVKVMAAAVPNESLQALLEPFEQADVPLHLVDLEPFCSIAGLGENLADGLLICATDQETTVSLMQAGGLVEYRMLPAISESAEAPQLKKLLREIRVLKQASGKTDLPLFIMGERGTQGLAEALQASGHNIELLSLEIGGQMVEGSFLPAVALALRARITKQSHSFNFRKGQFALKGEWANLKRKLVFLAAILGITVLITLSSMVIKYTDKAGQAEQLKTEMVNTYRSLFPKATTIVDVPLQLKSAIKELQAKGNMVTGGQISALAILKEVSLLPVQGEVEVQEFSLSSEELKLSGWTVSFEAVNQMAEALGESSLFNSVQISDAKMSLDGSRIDFRLLLSLARQGAEQ